MLAHNVYFRLQDGSPEAIDHLVAECKKYLWDHPGVLFFGERTRAGDSNRKKSIGSPRPRPGREWSR
jgi:hypothetical protein